MAYKTVAKAAGTPTSSVEGFKPTSGGGEVWFVTSNGKRESFITTPSSAAAIDEAMIKYAGALERLAKR